MNSKKRPKVQNKQGLYPYEVFKSAKELALSIDSLVSFINKQYRNSKNSKDNLSGFIAEKIKVEFSKQVTEMELRMEYATSTIIIVTPYISKINSKELEDRRTEILSNFGSLLPEAQYRSTIQFWLSLTETARKNLIKKRKTKKARRGYKGKK